MFSHTGEWNLHISFVHQGTFQQMWISKQEYEEGGKQCVDRKCPWFIYIFFLFHRNINYVLILNFCQKVNIFCDSHPNLDSGTHPGFCLYFCIVFVFVFLKYKYLYVDEASFSGVLWSIYKASYLVMKKKMSCFFHLHQSVALKIIYWNPYFFLNSDCYQKHSRLQLPYQHTGLDINLITTTLESNTMWDTAVFWR